MSLDLFGAETSTNAANYYASGLKGRFQEERRDDDHLLKGATRLIPEVSDSGIGTREVTQLAALNETLRDDYSDDCRSGLNRWNRTIDEAGVEYELSLPHVGFNRNVGTFAGRRVSPNGRLLDDAEWHSEVANWLPTDADREHVQALMIGVNQPGKMAGWVAPPSTGIHQKPLDFEYVKI